MTSVWTTETRSKEVAEELKNEITGKTVLITGATIGGLGGEAAYDIARYAKRLVLVGPNPDKLAKTEEKILADHKGTQVRTFVANLTSWASVRKAADAIVSLGEPINVIILNAAVWENEYVVGEDGYEKQFAGDHLAHFILVKRLLPVLRPSDSFAPRVVVISSSAHAFGSINFDDLTLSGGKEYSFLGGYARAKVANVLFAKELAKRAEKKGVLVYSVHPGAIQTHGWNRLPAEDKIKIGILKPDGSENAEFPRKQLDQGATSYLVAAFDPRIKDQSGSYIFDDGQIQNDKLGEFASKPENAVRLWELSEKITGEKFEF